MTNKNYLKTTLFIEADCLADIHRLIVLGFKDYSINRAPDETYILTKQKINTEE